MKQKALKSTAGISAVAALLVALFGGDLAWSYWQGFQGLARDSLKDATSVEFEMQRLHQAIDGLKPTLVKNRQIAAKHEAEIQFLADDTNRIEKLQELAKAEMHELRRVLKSSDKVMMIDDQEYDRKTIEADLSRRLEAYSLKEHQLSARKKLLAERHQTLAKVVNCIRENEHEQKLLADQAEALDAEIRLLEVAQSTSDLEFDQPAIATVRKQKRELQKRLETMRCISEQDGLGTGVEVNLDRRTVTERFDQTFAQQ